MVPKMAGLCARPAGGRGCAGWAANTPWAANVGRASGRAPRAAGHHRRACRRRNGGPGYSAAGWRPGWLRPERLGIAGGTNRCLRPVTTVRAALSSVQSLVRHARQQTRAWAPFWSHSSRPESFSGHHPDRVRAGHGQWRPPVIAGQQCWQACWGQPLASSNLVSSAILSYKNILVAVSKRALRDRTGSVGGLN